VGLTDSLLSKAVQVDLLVSEPKCWYICWYRLNRAEMYQHGAD
jgi:hypothetical protein